MSFVHETFSSASDGVPSSALTMQLSKEKEEGSTCVEKREGEGEKSLATAAQYNGFFIAKRGTLLKEGRYKIIRQLNQDHRSNTFLVEDLQAIKPICKYLTAKILSVDATEANGYIGELKILSKASEREDHHMPPLPILRDHFCQKGPHGGHYCFLTDPVSINVHGFRLSAPTGRLGVHFVKPIVAYTVNALETLHLRNIIHADIKADNILFPGPNAADIEETINKNPPLVDITSFDNTEYSNLRSEPFQPRISWDATPHIAELIRAVLDNFGAAFWADETKPSGDIGAFALRAPENIIRAECGKEIDIWAVGCMTYELLTGENLFQPQAIPGLTPDESLLLLQFAVTGETFSKDIVDKSRVRDKFFNHEGHFIKSSANTYPNRSMKERLTERCGGDLTERQINAAAQFISDCLRLDPWYRPTADELRLHPWLTKAFMGCVDHD